MNKLQLTALSAAASLLLAGSHSLDAQIVLDFDTDAYGNAIQAGQIIDDEYAPWGVNIETENLQKSFDYAIAFDSENPTGGDGDLRTGPGSYGTGNNPSDPLGNVLIISERSYDGNGDGLIDVPDDQAGRPAGYISFLYDIDQLSGEVVLLDIDEGSGKLYFFNDGNLLSGETLGIPSLGDNSRQTLAFSGFEFDRLVVFLKGSGAVGQVTTVPTPEPGTLLLLGTAAAGIIQQRRKRASA